MEVVLELFRTHVAERGSPRPTPPRATWKSVALKRRGRTHELVVWLLKAAVLDTSLSSSRAGKERERYEFTFLGDMIVFLGRKILHVLANR